MPSAASGHKGTALRMIFLDPCGQRGGGPPLVPGCVSILVAAFPISHAHMMVPSPAKLQPESSADSESRDDGIPHLPRTDLAGTFHPRIDIPGAQAVADDFADGIFDGQGLVFQSEGEPQQKCR
jgi:hypothetical protein